MHFARYSGFGSYYDDGTPEADYCNRVYPYNVNATQNRYNILCRTVQIPDIDATKPWTDAGRKVRGLPATTAAGAALDAAGKAAESASTGSGGSGSGAKKPPASHSNLWILGAVALLALGTGVVKLRG